MLVFLAIGGEVARLHQEWFLNTPVLWLGALVLIALVRGPLRNAPGLLKKPLKFAAASLRCTWLADLAHVGSGPQAASSLQSSAALWILLLGLSPDRLDRFVLLDFPGAIKDEAVEQPPSPLAGRFSERHQNLSKSFAMYQRNGSAISAAWKRQRNKFAR